MPKTKIGDLNMHYEIEGAGTPVVLISPLSGDHASWVMQVPALVAAGYRCLVFDSRDAGQTDQSASTYTIRQFAEDTSALMTAVGMGKAHLIGASMGGMIAQELAINHADQVLSQTLVCSAPVSDDALSGVLGTWKTLRTQSAPDMFFQAVVSPWLFTHRFFAEAGVLQGFVQMVRSNPFPQGAAGFARQCDAVLTHDTRSRLASISIPTHVVAGAEDILTPPRHSRELAERIRGATLTEIPAAAHGLFWEKAEAFNDAMLRFLAAQPKLAAV